MSDRRVAERTLHSEQERASGDSTLSAIKFIRPTEIIPGLVADALERNGPIGELITLQQRRCFAYPKAQQWLMDDLWGKEREEFDLLKRTGECSERLDRCMGHRGELFGKFAQPSDPTDIARDVVPNQRIAWADLMTEELEYLGAQAQWLDYHRAMAVHACGVMNRLLEGWTLPANGSIPPHLLPRLLDATRSILQGAPFKRLIGQDFSLEEAVVLSEVVTLAASLDDLELSEEVASLLPTVFTLCEKHLPEEFCKKLSNDIDFDDGCYDDEFDDDQFGDDEFDDTFEGDDRQADSDSTESDDDTDGPLVEPRYEILDEEEVVNDPTFIYSQYSEAEEESLREVLVPSLGLCLRELRRVPAREDRIEYLQETLTSFPMGMVLWQEVADTLISVSPHSFTDFLPLFLDKCIDDECGGLRILGVADYSFRKQLDPCDGPLPALVVWLKAMGVSDRQALLESAADFLDQAPELFSDSSAAEDGFRMLCKLLGVRGLMIGR